MTNFSIYLHFLYDNAVFIFKIYYLFYVLWIAINLNTNLLNRRPVLRMLLPFSMKGIGFMKKKNYLSFWTLSSIF